MLECQKISSFWLLVDNPIIQDGDIKMNEMNENKTDTNKKENTVNNNITNYEKFCLGFHRIVCHDINHKEPIKKFIICSFVTNAIYIIYLISMINLKHVIIQCNKKIHGK